jgi:protein phosphatase 1 regulatory subunit 10
VVKKALFQATIRPLLQPNSFSGAAAVQTLVSQIADYGSAEVDAQTRLDILTKIRDNAGNHYFRAWVENSTAIEITREWLKTGFTAKSDSPLVETIMPLLHVSRLLEETSLGVKVPNFIR